MKRLQDGGENHRHRIGLPQSDAGGLLKTGIFSFLLHMGLIIFLAIYLKSTITKTISIYHVTLRPFSSPGGGSPQRGSSPEVSSPSGETSHSPASIKANLEDHRKESEIFGVKKMDQKTPKKRVEKIERSKKEESTPDIKTFSEKDKKSKKEKESLKSLQEAIDEIHKMVALERIQRKVARRGGIEKRSTEGPSSTNPSQETTGSISKTPPLSGSGTGTGTGTGSGLGTGIGTGPGGPPGGSPWGTSLHGTSLVDSKLNEYYNLIWEKIKKEWTLPEDIPKGKTNLEAVIVIIVERDGKIQKTWFEKRSGNKLYDQMAMRAIKKAEPLPSFPKEFSENSFEIGIRFYPD